MPNWAKTAIDSIVSRLANVQKEVHAIAKLFVECIDRNPAFYNWFVDATSDNGVSAGFLRSLELAGRGSLDHRLVYSSVPHGNLIRRLPLSQQKQALDDTIPLLLAGGDVLRISIANATKEQVAQLLAHDHIRSQEEQAAWMKSASQGISGKGKTKMLGHDKVFVDRRRRKIQIMEAPLDISAAQLARYLEEVTK
jgi:hypothetical protein